jgi:hypothetical protein
MDAAHMHMEISNRQADADAIYSGCRSALDRARMLPGQANDPGDAGSLDAAVTLGQVVKAYIWKRAWDEHRMSCGDTGLTTTLYGVFIGHIPDEALGDQFYRSTRERYAG